MGSTRKRPQGTKRGSTIDDVSSVNGDKKGTKRAGTANKGNNVDPVIDPIFQHKSLIPEIFNYNDALSEN